MQDGNKQISYWTSSQIQIGSQFWLREMFNGEGDSNQMQIINNQPVKEGLPELKRFMIITFKIYIETYTTVLFMQGYYTDLLWEQIRNSQEDDSIPPIYQVKVTAIVS